MSSTLRLTVAQALVKFLSAQYSESDGEEQRLFAGCFGIFGHGNVAGIGQALLQAPRSALEGKHGQNDRQERRYERRPVYTRLYHCASTYNSQG